MTSLKHLFKLLILEQLTLREQAPEATTPNNVFGNWLAPDMRKLGVTEPDTDEEEKTIDALDDFFSANDPAKLKAEGGKIPNELIALMRKHQYSPVLDPGTAPVYRGLSFDNIEQFKAVIQPYLAHIQSCFLLQEENSQPQPIKPAQLQTITDTIYAVYGVIGPSPLSPKENRFVQSWTSEQNPTAMDFANRGMQGGMMIQSNVQKNNFFGKPGEIGKLGGFTNEMETVSVGTVTTDGAKFIYGPSIYGDVAEKYLLW